MTKKGRKINGKKEKERLKESIKDERLHKRKKKKRRKLT